MCDFLVCLLSPNILTLIECSILITRKVVKMKLEVVTSLAHLWGCSNYG